MATKSKTFSFLGKPSFTYVDPSSAKYRSRFSLKIFRWSDGDSYGTKIKRLATENKPDIYSNSNPDQTNIILSNMLSSSSDTVFLYEEKLVGDLLHRKNEINLLDEFKSFLDRKGRIEIVIDHGALIKNEIEEELKSLPNGVSLFVLNGETIKDKFPVGDIPYFAVGDKKSYRIENKKGDKERQAYGSFNDNKMSDELYKLFEVLKEHSTRRF